MSTRMDKEWNRFDTITHAVNMVGYEHHEIHSGSHFFIADYDTLANGVTVDFAVTTPNTTEWTHMTFCIEGSGALSIEIYRDSDYAADGSAITPINNNQNSTNTSGLTVQSDPTVTSAGTKIFAQYSGANRLSGIIERAREIMLKQNTKYLFRVKNETALDNIVSWNADWYEHVNKS